MAVHCVVNHREFRTEGVQFRWHIKRSKLYQTLNPTAFQRNQAKIVQGSENHVAYRKPQQVSGLFTISKSMNSMKPIQSTNKHKYKNVGVTAKF